MVIPFPSRLWRLLFLLAIALTLTSSVAQADTAEAETSLKRGHVDEAAAMLKQILKKDPHLAYAHQLLCRVYYSEDRADAAVTECERSVSDDPSRSDSEVWLGRAY